MEILLTEITSRHLKLCPKKKSFNFPVSLSDSPAPRCSSLARVKARSRLELFPFHVVLPLSHSQSCWPLLVQNPVLYHDPHPHLPLFGARGGDLVPNYPQALQVLLLENAKPLPGPSSDISAPAIRIKPHPCIKADLT